MKNLLVPRLRLGLVALSQSASALPVAGANAISRRRIHASASRSQQSFPNLLVKQNDGLRRITMADTKARNALSMELMSNLVTAINQDKSSNELRCITIEAADGPVFSAGHNLKELTRENGIETQQAIFSKCTELMLAIRNAEVPVIAVCKGLAAAAGCQLVSACDFAIASDKATFSTPGANFGIFCSTPGVGVSRVVNRSVAAYMVLTGLPLTASEALQAGLIVKAVPETKIESLLQQMYGQIKNKSRPVIALGKKFFHEQLKLSYEEALKQGGGVMVSNLQLADCQEGLQSFKEKRKPVWQHNETKVN